MKYFETGLAGAYIIELEPIEDERGFFARTFCRDEFAEKGLNSTIAQCSISYNARRSILRGMHYQVDPAAETKVVQCMRGSIYDVIVDLRSDSKTYCHWFGVELSENSHRLLYVPEGFAHGFQTLEDKTVIFYQISKIYAPHYSRGVRWDDPAFKIEWPFSDPILSEKDNSWPDFR